MYLLYIKRNKFVSLNIVRFIYGDVCSCILLIFHIVKYSIQFIDLLIYI